MGGFVYVHGMFIGRVSTDPAIRNEYYFQLLAATVLLSF